MCSYCAIAEKSETRHLSKQYYQWVTSGYVHFRDAEVYGASLVADNKSFEYCLYQVHPVTEILQKAPPNPCIHRGRSFSELFIMIVAILGLEWNAAVLSPRQICVYEIARNSEDETEIKKVSFMEILHTSICFSLSSDKNIKK